MSQTLITKSVLASKGCWPEILTWFESNFENVDAETFIAAVYKDDNLPKACGWSNWFLQAFLNEKDKKEWSNSRRLGSSGRGMANGDKKNLDIDFSKRI